MTAEKPISGAEQLCLSCGIMSGQVLLSDQFKIHGFSWTWRSSEYLRLIVFEGEHSPDNQEHSGDKQGNGSVPELPPLPPRFCGLSLCFFQFFHAYNVTHAFLAALIRSAAMTAFLLLSSEALEQVMLHIQTMLSAVATHCYHNNGCCPERYFCVSEHASLLHTLWEERQDAHPYAHHLRAASYCCSIRARGIRL